MKIDELSKKQQANSDDFTQANCDTENPYYVPMLPSYDGTTSDWPCSYAGTVFGDADENHNLFFWMYPAKDADAPVSIWLNGGPGASSTFANFLFSSPLRISQSGDESVGTTFTMSKSTETWID